MTLSEARQLIQTLVKDEANKLDMVVDFDQALGKALAFYSQKRPKVLSQTVAVGANAQVLTSAITDFDEGFIDQMMIEYPILNGSGDQTWLWRDTWELQTSNSGEVIRFYTVPEGQNVRFVHRVKHVLPVGDDVALTVRESDTEALCTLAAAEALQMLANIFTQTTDKYPQSDFAAFGNKGSDYESRARAYRRLFLDHIRATMTRQTMLARG
jgi:hypothetical protein